MQDAGQYIAIPVIQTPETRFAKLLTGADTNHDKHLTARELAMAFASVSTIDEQVLGRFLMKSVPMPTAPGEEPLLQSPPDIEVYNDTLVNREYLERYAFEKFGLRPEQARHVMKSFAPRIDDVHVSDMIDLSPRFQQTPTGTNTIRIEARRPSA